MLKFYGGHMIGKLKDHQINFIMYLFLACNRYLMQVLLLKIQYLFMKNANIGIKLHYIITFSTNVVENVNIKGIVKPNH